MILVHQSNKTAFRKLLVPNNYYYTKTKSNHRKLIKSCSQYVPESSELIGKTVRLPILIDI